MVGFCILRSENNVKKGRKHLFQTLCLSLNGLFLTVMKTGSLYRDSALEEHRKLFNIEFALLKLLNHSVCQFDLSLPIG